MDQKPKAAAFWFFLTGMSISFFYQDLDATSNFMDLKCIQDSIDMWNIRK